MAYKGVREEALRWQKEQAARIWVDMERGTFEPTPGRHPTSRAVVTPGEVNKNAIAREIGLASAPAWLDSVEFQKLVEIERVKRDVAYSEALGKYVGVGKRILGLSLAELFRRLTTDPESIPTRDLYNYGIKLMRLIAEYEGSVMPQGVQLTLVHIQQALERVQDPKARNRILEAMQLSALNRFGGLRKKVGAEPEEEGDVIDGDTG